MKRKKIKYLVGLSIIVPVLTTMVVMGKIEYDARVPVPTIVINQYAVSDNNLQQVADRIEQEVSYKRDHITIELSYNHKVYPVELKELSMSTNIHTIMQEFYDRQDALENKQQYLASYMNGKRHYLAIQYLFPEIEARIDEIEKEIAISPTDSRIVLQDGSVEILPSKDGLAIDREQLYQAMTYAFYETNQISLAIPTKAVMPKVKEEDNANCSRIRSEYTTNVSDSTGNRKYNVRLALERLNGLRVEPGQQVSFNAITGPHTLENGYKTAVIILNGKFTDGVGGGVCQASTTLYNALLKAGLQVDQAYKHTLPVKYVPLGLDAMVSEGISDLVFTNNSSQAITICTKTTSEDVTVAIVGEDMGNTRYEVRSEIVEVLPHKGDEVVLDYQGEYLDKVIFRGEQYRLAYPRQGYIVDSYIDRYDGDTLVETTRIRHDTYQPQKGKIVEGVKEVPPTLELIEEEIDVLQSQEETVSAEMFDLDSIEYVPTHLCP